MKRDWQNVRVTVYSFLNFFTGYWNKGTFTSELLVGHLEKAGTDF